MRDLDSYLDHCYDLLLKGLDARPTFQEEELCACANLVRQDENNKL